MLCAVSCATGGMSGGHYTAYIRPDSSSSSGNGSESSRNGGGSSLLSYSTALNNDKVSKRNALLFLIALCTI